jgi:hypothetical protein
MCKCRACKCYAKSILDTKGSKELYEEIKKDLQVEDPDDEKARAEVQKNTECQCGNS